MAERIGSVWTNRSGRPGRLGIAFAAVWLLFLISPLQEGWHRRGSVHGWVGILSVLAFCVVYLYAFAAIRHRRLVNRPGFTTPETVAVLALLTGLGLVTCASVGQAGMASVVYIAVTGVILLPPRLALGVVTVLAVATDLSGRLVPGWEDDTSLPFAVCTAAFAMWGVNQLMQRNIDLMRARDENAVLAVSSERNRFARDLHDILGHSLTVITVKAELANRLVDVDPVRARAEIADLERLSRDALADVRRAVEGFRDLSLAGELVRAREALTAAGIEPDLPGTTDDVPSELRELFAWTVREGVTNVVRHSGATTCRVRFAGATVEITDDGRGHCADASSGGHGLAGLRERATAAGAVLVTRSVEPRGFALSVAAR